MGGRVRAVLAESLEREGEILIFEETLEEVMRGVSGELDLG